MGLGNYKIRSALGLTVRLSVRKAPKLEFQSPCMFWNVYSFWNGPYVLDRVALSQDSQIPARVKNGPKQVENGDNLALLVSF